MIRYRSMARWIAVFGFSLFTVVAWAVPSVGAASNPTDSVTQSVTQAYGADSPLQKGMIVRLQDGDPTKVIALDTAHASAMQGVVVAANDAAVSLTGGNDSQYQVYVATFGRFDVLVSNQNGPIKKGDYISVSAIDGIGMKADANEPVVLGKANSDFTGTVDVIGSTTVKDTKGQNKGVSLGRISMTITVAHNPLQNTGNNAFPDFFQHVGSTIANKPVSAGRVYLAVAVLLVTALIAGSLLYGTVRSGVTSMGRNPLARKSIVRGMFQVIVTSLIVFIIGLFSVYLLLRL